ncbi:hypothetical protein GQ600_18463 [Phytophthora cactorum]|nr:hypothetical protein GQ600_18463 [Phytophthora cactorum]
MSGKGDSEDWNDLGTVLKSSPFARNMGVVEVAANMGTRKDDQVVDVHKKVSARAKRRHKRQERLNKHDFY